MKTSIFTLLTTTGVVMGVVANNNSPAKQDVCRISVPVTQNIRNILRYKEFVTWHKKKEKEDALKFLMLEGTTLTGSSKTLTVEQQKQFEKVSSNLVFIENKGQWDSDVLYLCRMGGLDAWITKYGVNYTFYKLEEVPSGNKNARSLPDKFDHKDYNMIGHRVLMKLQNYNPNPAREGKEKQEGYYNYFIGNDPGKHASYVGLYKEVVVKDVYNGIDLRYYFDKGNLRYDYVVHPGADPSQIVFSLEGSDKTYVNERGNLVFTTSFGEVAMAELKTYQADDKKQVLSRFVKRGKGWSIEISNYDTQQLLVIDPLVYSTYIGGSGNDEGWGITVDGSGNAYVTGSTYSTNYDVTAGAFQTTRKGGYDVFVTKLNASGSGLVYSTYIGGNLIDYGYGIAVDGSGNAYVTGQTNSNDYVVTAGAFQTIKGGNYDVFVTKLNASGSGLVYSTYIGGIWPDYGYSIAVDGSGNAYVTGNTTSTDYDITAGAFQTTYGGGNSFGGDVIVTKLNASGSGLVYSTYIGGSGHDDGWGGIAVDGSGNAYVTGRAESNDYDVTVGVFQTTWEGGTYDVFVTKLCPDPACNLLPIELLYFEVQPYYEGDANKVLLIWETATERNNYFFTIERSKDAIHFDELCKIKGAGNSYHNISYQFIDEYPYEGVSYYRLKQTDYDGRFKYSFIRAVTIKFERGGRYSVYPNPSYGTFSLQTKETGVFEILDLTGRLLNAYNIRNNTETIHTNLPTGIYFIREKGSGAAQKLIIK